jgi:MoaA/NifB/PqqE/SkfB family radical SAM enzyme|tara:strand:+ start:774 stop:1931 length:1158 start_codon:yes stop_codon:yes gene_type:complete
MSCVLPFINLEARTDGTMSVCCIMQESAKKDDGTEFNLANGDTLSDVKESKWLKDMQQKFLNNEKLEACNNCWHEEKAGIQSKRLRENFYWGEDFTPNTKALDLKLGNICNSKCRICSSFASSQWAAEELKINPNNEGARLFNKLGMWPKTNENFWEDIDSHLKNIEKLEFFGGEPLMIERHYEILERCVELGIAKNIALSYNTNGSIFPENRISLWEKFKKVEIFLSIDDINERFEYIRFPGNFTEVVTNLGHFSKLNPDIFSIGIFQTISIFNIMHMTELTEFISKHFEEIDIHYNMVFTPSHISPKVLPKRVKEKINVLYGKNNADHVNNTLKFMNGEQYESSEYTNFLLQTKQIDKFRKEQFDKVFPKFFKLIEKDWNGIQ